MKCSPVTMSVPTVRQFCCCVSLHAGTLIIGCWCALISLLEVFVYTLIVTLRPLGAGSDAASAGEAGAGGADAAGAGGLSLHKFVFFSVLAVVSFVQLVCAALLIVGTVKRRASLTLPWTAATGAVAAVFLLLCATAAGLVLQDAGSLLREELLVIGAHFARACVSVYFIMVVHSRHKEIMAEKNERRFIHSARLYSPVWTDDVR